MTIRFSILDQSIINPGEQPSEALRNTVELAQLAEKLGYHRFWVAEHHNSDFGRNSWRSSGSSFRVYCCKNEHNQACVWRNNATTL